MNKEKKKLVRDYVLSIFLYITFFLVILLLIQLSIKGIFIEKEKIKKYNYDLLKEETIEYLNNNIEELEAICKVVLEEKTHPCREYNDLNYCYDVDDTVNVLFYKHGKYKDNKNYFGEQDWGLIYSQKDILNGKNVLVWNQNKEEGYGNNIMIKTRITDNWYFYYVDYNYEKDDIISDIENN